MPLKAIARSALLGLIPPQDSDIDLVPGVSRAGVFDTFPGWYWPLGICQCNAFSEVEVLELAQQREMESHRAHNARKKESKSSCTCARNLDTTPFKQSTQTQAGTRRSSSGLGGIWAPDDGANGGSGLSLDYLKSNAPFLLWACFRTLESSQNSSCHGADSFFCGLIPLKTPLPPYHEHNVETWTAAAENKLQGRGSLHVLYVWLARRALCLTYCKAC